MKTITFKELLENSDKVFYAVNPSETETAINYYEVLGLLQKVRKATLIEAASKAEIIDIMEPACNDHTPYWVACISCGRYDNPDIMVGSKIDKDSILNLDKNSIEI